MLRFLDKHRPERRDLALGMLCHGVSYGADGLAEIWKGMAAGLPEKDRVDVARTTKLFEHCAALVEDSWEEILDEVVRSVADRLRKLGAI